ncbi:MAG: hypothetical protein O3B43_01580 [Chloroflexi bacterium]|nr:hypothetical protein [Chloroflexota bacterium]
MDSSPQPKSVRRFNLEALREPRTLAAAAFAVGVLVGWWLLGWWLWPVEWTDASAQDLNAAAQQDYMRMAIDSYTLVGDENTAERRLDDLGEGAEPALAAVAAVPGDQNDDSIAAFQDMLGVRGSAEPSADIFDATPSDSDSNDGALLGTGSLLLTMCSITAVLGAALGVLYYVRRRQSSKGDLPAVLRAQEYTRGAEQTDFATTNESPPLSQWMTTYLLGDDLFDDSFSIDSPNGEFMGECGVGIAETIGVGDPKRVSAFELWLFDKNDIQTVTKVLMSSHTFRDDTARDRLSAKGEPLLASAGAETVLETETLQLVARVVDMDYGEGALPEESFFERVTLELAVWSKI